MTPEELSFNENFLYPLFLLLIGGGLSVGLIKLFNFFNEIKLRRIESQRTDNQLRIDREREDYKFELEIKEKLVLEIGEREAWFSKKFDEISYFTRENDVLFDYKKMGNIQNDLDSRDNIIRSLLKLYFRNEKLVDKNYRVLSMMGDSLYIANCKEESKEWEEEVKKFHTRFNLKMKESDSSFIPSAIVAGETETLNQMIINSIAALNRPEY